MMGGIAGALAVALAVASSIRQIETIRPDKAGQPHAKPWRKMGTRPGRIYKPNGPRECARRVRQRLGSIKATIGLCFLAWLLSGMAVTLICGLCECEDERR